MLLIFICIGILFMRILIGSALFDFSVNLSLETPPPPPPHPQGARSEIRSGTWRRIGGKKSAAPNPS